MRLAIVLMLLAAVSLHGEDVEGRVKALIADLSSADSEARDRATAALIAVGPPAEKLLEETLASKDVEVRERARQALDAIRLERRIGPSAWIDLPAKETPLTEAFDLLAKRAGRKLDASAVDLTGRSLPGGLGRVPFWDALDRLARAGGCSYAWPFSETVALAPEPLPEVPTFHDGPFRLVVDDVTVTRTLELDGGGLDATSELSMTLAWEPHVRPFSIESSPRITVAVDDQGGSMTADAADGELKELSGPDDEAVPSQACWVSLGAPTPGATRIARLEGELEVLFLLEREEAAFDAEARRTRATLTAGPVEVHVTAWTPRGEGAVTSITVTGLGVLAGGSAPGLIEPFGGLTESVQFSLRGADGATVVSGDLSGTTTWGGQDRADLQVGFDSLPPGDYQLVVAVATKTLSRPVKFAFKDIPLP